MSRDSSLAWWEKLIRFLTETKRFGGHERSRAIYTGLFWQGPTEQGLSYSNPSSCLIQGLDLNFEQGDCKGRQFFYTGT